MVKICKCCGKQFEHMSAVRLYCSSECYDKVNRARAKKRGTKGIQEVEKNCEYCGKEFTQRGHKQIDCSVECRKNIMKSSAWKQRVSKPKKPSSIKEMAIEARKHGMSYGKYVAMLEKGVKP